ncbi:MAG: class I SAM-dependent methyltransferase [Chloroflexia bacterium]
MQREQAGALVEQYGRSASVDDKPAYFRLHRRRYLALLEALEAPPGSRVLEIGCNPGQFTEILVRAGYRVWGLDLRPEDRASLWERLGVEVRRGNLETEPLPYAENSFEAVVLSEVVEHLAASPLPALQEVHRVLLPGGHLILSTPNACSLRERLLLAGRLLSFRSLEPAEAFHRRMRLRGEERYTMHQRLYTAGELRWLLREAGFERVRVAYVAAREGVGVTWRRVLFQPWRGVPKALLWGLALLLPPLRSTLLAVARKGDATRCAPA